MARDRREIARELAARLGVPVEVPDEPIDLTADQAATLARGEFVTGWTGRAPRHPDHPDYSADATDEEIAQGMRDDAAECEAGQAPAFVPDANEFALEMSSDYRRERKRVAKERAEARRAGRPQPPFPEPPAEAHEAAARAQQELGRRQRERARSLRAEARKIEGRGARHHSRVRAPRTMGFARRGPSRERTDSPSRGDPELPGEADEPPGDCDRPPHLLLPDLELHLRHAGPLGVERDFLIEQVAAMGHAAVRVSAGISLLISLGIARAGIGDCDVPVIYPVFGGRSR